eukprot:4571631-Pleurochrysis_carterae.AAC.1
MDTSGRGDARPVSRNPASFSALVAALRRSMPATSRGHHSDTIATPRPARPPRTHIPPPRLRRWRPTC